MIHQIAGLASQSNLTNRDRAKFQAACINQCKFSPVPVCITIQTVARCAGHIFDDRDTFANHTIKKRGFADVWPTHDSNKRLHKRHLPPFHSIEGASSEDALLDNRSHYSTYCSLVRAG